VSGSRIAIRVTPGPDNTTELRPRRKTFEFEIYLLVLIEDLPVEIKERSSGLVMLVLQGGFRAYTAALSVSPYN
jgi:hypothetical protein